LGSFAGKGWTIECLNADQRGRREL